MEGHPVACDLQALSAEERGQREELVVALRGALRSSRELLDGYALVFDRAREGELEELAGLERRCCAFMQVEVVRSEHGLELVLHGPAGTKALLAAELGLLSARGREA